MISVTAEHAADWLCLTGYDAELPQEIRRVPVDPVVNGLPVLELPDGAPMRDCPSVRGRDTHEVAAMRPGGGPASCNEVALGKHLVEVEVKDPETQ